MSWELSYKLRGSDKMWVVSQPTWFTINVISCCNLTMWSSLHPNAISAWGHERGKNQSGVIKLNATETHNGSICGHLYGIYYLEFECLGFHAVTTPNLMHYYTKSNTMAEILWQILQWDYIHNSVSSRGKKSPLVLLFHRDWIEMRLDGTEQTQEVPSTLVMCSNLSLLSTFNSMTMKLK